MARKKVKLAFIEHSTTRRTTYKKRVRSIVKKAEELSTLCGVDVCTIVYGPYDQAPVMCPSSEAEAKRIIWDFRRRPEVDQSERRLNQEMYLKQTVTKEQEKLIKLETRNREIELENLISDVFSGKLTLDQISPRDSEDMVCVIDDKLRTIQHKIKVANTSLVINPSADDDGNTSVSNNNQSLNTFVDQTSSREMQKATTSQNHME